MVGGSPDHHGLTSLEIRTFLANLAMPMFCLLGIDLAPLFPRDTPERDTGEDSFTKGCAT